MSIGRTILLCTVTLHTLLLAGQTSLQPVEQITVKQIVAHLAENNLKRRQALQAYTSQRTYHLLYTGFAGHHEADMVVNMKYEAPASKDFTVVSQSGSHWIANRVFKRLLDTEREAADEKNQERTALTEDNYDFELLGQEEIEGRNAYILQVAPKTASKLLYRGKIWVDAEDFALARIEAEPAKQPSFLISKTIVHHTYHKIGDFWLPVENVSTTDVRLGGHATLSIHYGDYKVVSDVQSPQPPSPHVAGEHSALDAILGDMVK